MQAFSNKRRLAINYIACPSVITYLVFVSASTHMLFVCVQAHQQVQPKQMLISTPHYETLACPLQGLDGLTVEIIFTLV